MSDAANPGWMPKLQKAIASNYTAAGREQATVQATFTTVSGMPFVQPLVFQGFLEADPRLLLFSASVLNADLMGVLKASNPCQVIWMMPRSGEVIYVGGKMLSVTSSQYSYRFGAPPRKAAFAAFTATNPALAIALRDRPHFWEEERLRQFNCLSDRYRATFTWPGPGEPLTAETAATATPPRTARVTGSSTPPRAPAGTLKGPSGATTPPRSPIADGPHAASPRGGVARVRSFSGMEFGYKYTVLASGESTAGSPLAMASSDHECATTIAQDNFALLVLRPASVDFSVPPSSGVLGLGGSTVGVRQLYEMDSRSGAWLEQTVTPFHVSRC